MEEIKKYFEEIGFDTSTPEYKRKDKIQYVDKGLMYDVFIIHHEVPKGLVFNTGWRYDIYIKDTIICSRNMLFSGEIESLETAKTIMKSTGLA